jgi:hypothetical protein
MWLNLIKSYQVGLAIVFLIDDSRPLLMSSSAVGRCGPGQVLARETLAASEDHEVGHEHFVDDVNDAIISTHIGMCNGRTIDLHAFQQG